MRFTFIIVMWGEEYVDKFLNLSLPTLMADDNLPGFPWLAGAKFHVMTPEADVPRLRASSMYRHLEEIINIHVSYIDEILPNPDAPEYNRKYIRLSMAQSRAIELEGNGSDGLFFLYPDFIYSNGCITRAAQRIVEGYCAVCAPVPFLNETILQDDLFNKENLQVETLNGPIALIPSRKLVELSIKYPHPIMDGFQVDGDKIALWPGYYIWNVPDQGWLFHCFHLHPLVLRTRPENPNFFRKFELSLDDEYVSSLFQIGDNIYFPQDSDEIALCSTRPINSGDSIQPGWRGDTLASVRWAEEFTGSVQRDFTKVPFKWHFVDLDQSKWDMAEQRGKTFMARIRERLNVPDMTLSFEDPITYEARKRRRYNFSPKF